MFQTKTFTDGDEGRYVMLAKSIAEGEGQSLTFLPEPKAEALTPPLYPLLLGLSMQWFDAGVAGLKMWSYFFYLCFVIVSIRFWDPLLRESYPDVRLRYALYALFLCSVFPLLYSWSIFTEHAYLCTSFLALYAAHHKKHSFGNVLACAAFTAISLMLRPIGLALIPAIGLHYLLRKGWIQGALYGLLTTLFYAPVILRTYHVLGVPFAHMTHYNQGDSVAASPGIFTAFAEKGAVIGQLLPVYVFDSFPRHLFFSLFDGDCLLCILGMGVLIPGLKMLLGSLATLGLALRLPKLKAVDTYTVVYLILVSTYYVALERGIEDRMILPVFPMLVIYVFHVLLWLQKRLRLPTSIPYILILLSSLYVITTALIAGSIRFTQERTFANLPALSPQRHLALPEEERQAFGRFIEAANWIEQQTEEDAIIYSRLPMHMWFLSQRKGFRFALLRDENYSDWEQLILHAQKAPLYIVEDAYPTSSSFGRDRERNLTPLLRQHPEKFTLVHATKKPVTKVWLMHK